MRLHQPDGSTRNVKGFGNRWHYHQECELTMITAADRVRSVGADVTQLAEMAARLSGVIILLV